MSPDVQTQASFPDAWIGLLKEPKTAESAPLGPTLRAMFIDQFARTIFGKKGWFYGDDLAKTERFQGEVETTKYGDVIALNTQVPVSGRDVFFTSGVAPMTA